MTIVRTLQSQQIGPITPFHLDELRGEKESIDGKAFMT